MSWPPDVYVGCLAKRDVPGSKTCAGPAILLEWDDVPLMWGEEVIVLDICDNLDGQWAWFYKVDTAQVAWIEARYLEMIV